MSNSFDLLSVLEDNKIYFDKKFDQFIINESLHIEEVNFLNKINLHLKENIFKGFEIPKFDKELNVINIKTTEKFDQILNGNLLFFFCY